MNLILWVILGGLAGWIASIITGKNEEMGFVLNIVVGIAGAIVGGTVAGLLGVNGIGDLSVPSLVVAVLGAIVLISIVKIFDHQQPQKPN